jgi:uncharacterized protein DUF1501
MLSRRQFHQTVLAGASSLVAGTSRAASPQGKAEACILLWLGGGMCHLDTFDPKRLGDPARRRPGSAYPSIETAVAGVRVCSHLERTARLLDRAVILRTVHHQLAVEHAAATNLVKTGRAVSDTVVYPSLGSIVSHQLGSRQPGVPTYVVMGYPNVTRGPGFLGAKHGYIYLTDTAAGPHGLRRPPDVSDQRNERRMQLLGQLRTSYRSTVADDRRVADYEATASGAFRLAGPEFTRVFDLEHEPDELRNRYGDEFGQRCLLARRLVEAGSRFVEVSFNLNFLNGTGWDTHNEGQRHQHRLIRGLDRALSALVEDLQRRKLLDRTLVVVATEFGRPPEFDGGGGRGHHAACFSTVLFGGGLKLGQAIGATDDLGKTIVDRPITIADWHATLHAALGIDPGKVLLAPGDRPVPITDNGRVVPGVLG